MMDSSAPDSGTVGCAQESAPEPETVKGLTAREMLDVMAGDSLLNIVRKEISSYCGRSEQQSMQRRAPNPIDMRRDEFAIAEKVIGLVRAAIARARGEEGR